MGVFEGQLLVGWRRVLRWVMDVMVDGGFTCQDARLVVGIVIVVE